MYISAVGLSDANDARFRAMLIHSLGSEGQQIFRSLGPATTDCVTLLAGHFAASQSVIVRRIVFRRHHQRPGELVHHYIADLQCLASLCKFGRLEEQMIWDQLAEHTIDPKLREKPPRWRLITAGAEELYGYGHAKIGMVGTCTFSVSYGSRFLLAFTFELSRHGANLLGFDLFCALGFSITDNTGTAILTVTTPWQHRWPSLFFGLGCLNTVNHQPLIDPTVSPVIQPLRRLPLSLRDNVTAKLQKLLDAGIIERVDASPWISNLVVAKKKSAGLRPCVDHRQANKAVIPDKYSLPTMEEVFSKLDLRQGYLQVPLHPDSCNLTAFVSHMVLATTGSGHKPLCLYR
ncbi:hypothetical protein L3Q82_015296 [Scortum barcoo]|uniref:Uncharacterized protein n=1 Tax=Scortum barcoo TaxID=214431 RepID=A0ACB8VTY2_9TELE|nr:hypothetical protein L3Q82_015296 [Scortum barcoo]